MKVLLYSDNMNLVQKSGVYRAYEHQKEALTTAGVSYTINKEDDYDIVHINTVFPASFRMSIRSKLKGKKVVYHAHSTKEDFRNSFKGSNLLAPFFKQWIKLCYNSADVIITPTEYSAKLIKSYGIRKTIVPISNGISMDEYQRDQELGRKFRKKYGYQELDRVVISVGHYMERKGILDFIELAKLHPEYQFIWFGYTAPSLVTEHVRQAMKVKLPNLQFAGYVEEEQLKEAYYGSDLFLFLSHEETEGIVVLEALASKIPVLLRDIPVYEGWINDGMEAYKADNQKDFSAKLEGILEGKLKSTVADGYRLACLKDIRKVGKKLEEAYHMAESKQKVKRVFQFHISKLVQ